MKKTKFYTEWAYVAGILILALGSALMERANFGMSMVVAPAYILHLKISESLAWFTFGKAEYCLQAVLLIITALVLRKFKLMYLFSFITAVIYGVILDLWISIVACLPGGGIPGRTIFFITGMICCSIGVSLLFHTYIAPEAYELLVKEISDYTHWNINKVKTAYDCISCGISVILSFAFFGFGEFRGVYIGTILCALVNGTLIGFFSRMLEKFFDFCDGTKMRKYFQ